MQNNPIYTITVQQSGGRDRVCCATTKPLSLKRSVVYLLHKGMCHYDGNSRSEMVRRFRKDWNQKETEQVNRHLVGCRIDCFQDGGLENVFRV